MVLEGDIWVMVIGNLSSSPPPAQTFDNKCTVLLLNRSTVRTNHRVTENLQNLFLHYFNYSVYLPAGLWPLPLLYVTTLKVNYC